MGPPTALAYEIRPYAAPDDLRPAAHLKCPRCGDVGKIHIAGMSNNPEKIGKFFVRLGWDADMHHWSRNLCPKCVKLRETRSHPIDTKPRRVLLPVLDNPDKGKALVSAASSRAQDFALGAGVRSTPKAGEVTIRTLSAKQKADLRSALDDNFDPDAGRWAKDWSDHVVSELLDIPRILVAEFRENFYGELKEDPDTQEFRDGLATVKNMQKDMQSMISRLETLLEKIINRE